MEKVLSKSGIELGGQAEVQRRQVIAENNLIDMLRGEVKTLQGQLQAAYVRIHELNSELNKHKNKG